MAGQGCNADLRAGLSPQPVRQEDFGLYSPGQFVCVCLEPQLPGCMQLRLHVLE